MSHVNVSSGTPLDRSDSARLHLATTEELMGSLLRMTSRIRFVRLFTSVFETFMATA